MTLGGWDGLDLLRPGGESHVDYADLLSGSTATLDDLDGFGRAIEGEWGWLYERQRRVNGMFWRRRSGPVLG